MNLGESLEWDNNMLVGFAMQDDNREVVCPKRCQRKTKNNKGGTLGGEKGKLSRTGGRGGETVDGKKNQGRSKIFERGRDTPAMDAVAHEGGSVD